MKEIEYNIFPFDEDMNRKEKRNYFLKLSLEHIGKIPIVLDKASDYPLEIKKGVYMIQWDILSYEFIVDIIKKENNISYMEPVYILLKNGSIIFPSNLKMIELYNTNKSEDGFLYVYVQNHLNLILKGNTYNKVYKKPEEKKKCIII